MKYPTVLFAFIAFAARVMACGLVFVCSIDGQPLGRAFPHRVEKIAEVVLPCLAHLDANITVVSRHFGSEVRASSFYGGPDQVRRGLLASRTMPMLRFVNFQQSAFLALSRSAALEVVCGADGFRSAVATTQPELRAVESDGRPFPESLSSQVDDAGLVVTVATHRCLPCEQVVADLDLFRSAITSAIPVLADDVREHDVFSETLSRDVSKSFSASHASFSLKNAMVRSFLSLS